MPVFPARPHAESVSPRLVYEAGQPVAYECTLSAGQTLAFRWQTLLPREAGEGIRPLTASPMRALAEAYYLQPGWSLRGQLAPTEDETWPPLLVAKHP
jgi:hypothetical protein